MFLFFISPIAVSANIICNDGTVSKTCSVCSRGCCSRHGGCSNSSSTTATTPKKTTNKKNTTTTQKKQTTTNSSNKTTTNNSGIINNSKENVKIKDPVIIKSDDTTIKSIKANEEILMVKDSMFYVTYEDSILLDIVLNDEKATFNVEGNLNNLPEFSTVKIIVTAESSKTKEYEIQISKLEKTPIIEKDISSKIIEEPKIDTDEDDKENGIVTTIISLIVTGGVGYGSFQGVKKIKEKKS